MGNEKNQSKSNELRRALLKKWVVPLEIDRRKEGRTYDISSLKDQELKKEEEIFKNFMEDDFI